MHLQSINKQLPETHLTPKTGEAIWRQTAVDLWMLGKFQESRQSDDIFVLRIMICKLFILPIIRNKHGMGTRDINMFKREDLERAASKVRSVSSAKDTGAVKVKLRDNELELAQHPFGE